MDTIIGALIAAIVTLVTAWLGMRHYFKQRQRELKETVYIEYVQHLQQHLQCQQDSEDARKGKDIASRRETKEARRAFAASTARLYLLGCEKVINALFEFNAIKVNGKGENNDKKQAIYDQLVKNMRKDLGLSSNKKYFFSAQIVE